VCIVVQHAKATVFFPDCYSGDLVPSLIQDGGALPASRALWYFLE